MGIWLAAFTGAFEATGLGPAYPLIAEELSNSSNVASYITAFMASGFVSTVLVGSVLSREQFTRVFLSASVVQAAGLLLCGGASAEWVFIAGRAIQGFGEGAITVAIFFAFTQFVEEPAARARALASISLAWLGSAVLAPLVYWVLPQGMWRPVFLILVILSVVSLLLVVASFRHAFPAVRPGSVIIGRTNKLPAWLVVSAIILFTFSQIVSTWSSPVIAVGVGLVVLVGVTYLLLSGHLGLRATMSSKMLSVLSVRASVSTIYTVAMTFLPVVLYAQLDMEIALVAIVSAAAAVGWTTGAHLQAGLVRRSARFQLGSGMALVAVGIGGVAGLLENDATWYFVACAVFVAGVGTGITANALPAFISEISESGRVAQDLSAAESVDTISTTVVIAVIGATVAPHLLGDSHGVVTLVLYSALSLAAALTSVLVWAFHDGRRQVVRD